MSRVGNEGRRSESRMRYFHILKCRRDLSGRCKQEKINAAGFCKSFFLLADRCDRSKKKPVDLGVYGLQSEKVVNHMERSDHDQAFKFEST